MDKNLNKKLVDENLKTVILVEDNINYRETLAGIIDTSSKFSCEGSCGSGEEVLRILETGIAPDIILLDIGLPGMSGLECINKIKAISPASHVIILTVFDDNDNIFKALCSGASGYLLKDSSTESIINSISEVLGGGAPINPQIAKKMLEMFTMLAAPIKDYGLTDREKEILKLLVEGPTKKKISKLLFISYHTVDTHLKNIYAKLQVHTRSGAVAKVLKENLV